MAQEHPYRRTGLARFLKDRRARLQPMDYQLPAGQRRRTPGLRREELAQLIGVGVSWYTWLEQGRDIHVSDQVLEQLATILKLNEEEHQHLLRLAQLSLEEMIEPECSQDLNELLRGFLYPARIYDQRMNLLTCNASAQALFGEPGSSLRERNAVWQMFMDPRVRALHPHWEADAYHTVALLQACYDRFPHDVWLRSLVEDLRQRSSAFRSWWKMYHIQVSCGFLYEIHHPELGRMLWKPVSLLLPDHPELQLMLYQPANAETQARLERLAYKKVDDPLKQRRPLF